MIDLALIGTWVAVLLTILVYSAVLYKETVFFRFVQMTFVGVSVGYVIALAVKSVHDVVWTSIVGGEYIYVIPLILGLLLYTRFIKRLERYNVWSMAFIIAVGAALAIRANIHAYFIQQIQATMLPLITIDPLQSFNNIVIVIGTFTAMLYFFFTREFGGQFKKIPKIGRIFIMVALGSFFGALILTRLTLITARIRFLLESFGILPK